MEPQIPFQTMVNDMVKNDIAFFETVVLMVRDIFSMADKKIWVAGHNGMVGSAILRRLKTEICSVVTVGREELDLRDQSEVQSWMGDNKVNVVILAAAKVGEFLPIQIILQSLFTIT